MRSAPRPSPNLPSVEKRNGQKYAVLIDGSALYLTARGFYEGRQLDYHALVNLLTSEITGLPPAAPGRSDNLWVMWTSASPQNAGQTRFLEFAENDLHWTVRRFNPVDSFMVEPATVLGLSSGASGRFVRFDARIAFAIGRLAEDHRIVVLTDSFALADPLLQASRLGAQPVLAFFGRGLDPRWQGVLRKAAKDTLEFIDLDDSEELLFGSKTKEVRTSDDVVF